MLVDSHCHIQDEQFDADREGALARARQAGVRAFVVVGWDLESSRRAVALADEHSDVYAVIGVHPHFAGTWGQRTRRALYRLGHSSKVVAVGETGLDFYRNLSPPEVQRRAFREQLELAAELRRPVVVHSRQAEEETLAIISAYEREMLGLWPKDRPLGQMHCFSGDIALALQYVQMGFLVSIAATCTYPNGEKVRSVAAGVPLRWLTVETDAPYLPPQSRRGQRNEPAYLTETVEAIARLRGESQERVSSGTALAAAWLFGLGDLGEESR